jgi:hypothetical protein
LIVDQFAEQRSYRQQRPRIRTPLDRAHAQQIGEWPLPRATAIMVCQSLFDHWLPWHQTESYSALDHGNAPARQQDTQPDGQRSVNHRWTGPKLAASLGSP